MSKHSLCHFVKINADHATVRDALMTAEGLEGWTEANVSSSEDTSGKWSFDHQNGPSFVWQIKQHDANTVTWQCIDGPGDSAGTTATFQLAKAPDGRVHLSLEHGGWPHQEGNFAKCNSLWGMMLHRLRDYAEKGQNAASSH